MYLLDTDWIIQVLAGRQPASAVLDRLAGSRIFVSWDTAGEIYEQAFHTPNPPAALVSFRYFLSFYRVLGLSDPIMEQFAEIRASLRRHGQLITDLDLLIAATALHHNLTLLTFNRRDFERIPELTLHQPS
jgi:tRNA(fMet)-specific endonuclease VapC